jgi:hypothetical protein
MKRFLVVTASSDGGVELHAMKEWLRNHPSEVPTGLDATESTSHQLRRGLKAAGWRVYESDKEVRLIRPADRDREALIENVLGPVSGSDDNEESDSEAPAEQSFGMEYQLRDFLAQNITTCAVGVEQLQLYVDPTGRDGVEYPTDVGPIDILAVNHAGDFTVFELKRARTADRAVGQLARYMGWVHNTIGRGKKVSGVIVARLIDERLRYAASVIPNVSLFEYRVQFSLNPVPPTSSDP